MSTEGNTSLAVDVARVAFDIEFVNFFRGQPNHKSKLVDTCYNAVFEITRIQDELDKWVVLFPKYDSVKSVRIKSS